MKLERDMSHGTNGTSATPVCDLIEIFMSRDMSRGQLEIALKAARAIEAAFHAKTVHSGDFLLQNREKERLRKAAYRAKKSHEMSRDKSGTQRESVLKKEGIDSVVVSKKERKKDPPGVPGQNAGHKPAPESDWPADYQAQFWVVFPRRTEKKAAMAKLDAIRKSGKVTWSRFLAGVNRYAMHVASTGTEERYVKHPTTWLNRGCWDDEFTIRNGGSTNETDRRFNSERVGFAGIAARLRRSAAEGTAAGFDAGGDQSRDRCGDPAGVVELEAGEWSASAEARVDGRGARCAGAAPR